MKTKKYYLVDATVFAHHKIIFEDSNLLNVYVQYMNYQYHNPDTKTNTYFVLQDDNIERLRGLKILDE